MRVDDGKTSAASSVAESQACCHRFSMSNFSDYLGNPKQVLRKGSNA